MINNKRSMRTVKYAKIFKQDDFASTKNSLSRSKNDSARANNGITNKKNDFIASNSPQWGTNQSPVETYIKPLDLLSQSGQSYSVQTINSNPKHKQRQTFTLNSYRHLSTMQFTIIITSALLATVGLATPAVRARGETLTGRSIIGPPNGCKDISAWFNCANNNPAASLVCDSSSWNYLWVVCLDVSFLSPESLSVRC
jgi:hypothetical protein